MLQARSRQPTCCNLALMSLSRLKRPSFCWRRLVASRGLRSWLSTSQAAALIRDRSPYCCSAMMNLQAHFQAFEMCSLSLARLFLFVDQLLLGQLVLVQH